MPRHAASFVVSVFVMVAVGGSARPASAQTETLRLAVRIIDYAAIPPHVLRSAMAETERVFTGIGVEVQDADEERPAASRTVNVIMLDARRADQKKEVSVHALGTAPGTPTARGHIAYVLYDRVENTARRHARIAGELLGLVMAHEIGHLLLPYNAHAPNSIMQADWDSGFIMGLRVAEFTSEQGAYIRSELAEPVSTSHHNGVSPENR